MTTATNAQQADCLTALSAHGFASIDDARAENIFFVCHKCGSVKSCSPAEDQTREQARDALISAFEGMDECCDDGDNSIL